MPRFYLAPECWEEVSVLTGDEALHCSRVMRVRVGDLVQVFDGLGCRADAEVLSSERNRVELKLRESTQQPKPRVALQLWAAMLKGKAMELMIQKAVEIGVDEIIPVTTERTIAKYTEGSREKWIRVGLESCKQCGTDFLPEIREPRKLVDLTDAGAPAGSLPIFASLGPDTKLLRERFEIAPHIRSVVFLIGPEGDFSPDESARIIDSGFLPTSLGRQVLRGETAAMYCLSAARYAFG